jgi:hypothetical protein
MLPAGLCVTRFAQGAPVKTTLASAGFAESTHWGVQSPPPLSWGHRLASSRERMPPSRTFCQAQADVVNEVLSAESTGAPPVIAHPISRVNELTPGELQVAQLAARGLCISAKPDALFVFARPTHLITVALY